MNFWCFGSSRSGERPTANPAMLTWQFMHEKLPWGLVLLLGIILQNTWYLIGIYWVCNLNSRKWFCFIGCVKRIGFIDMVRKSAVCHRSSTTFLYLDNLLYAYHLDDRDSEQYCHSKYCPSYTWSNGEDHSRQSALFNDSGCRLLLLHFCFASWYSSKCDCLQQRQDETDGHGSITILYFHQ